MIRIPLLIRENIPHTLIAAPGNVDAFVRSIEIDAVHALDGGETRHLLAGLRIHGDHLRGRTCADKQLARFFVKGSVTVALAAHRPRGYDLAFLRIHNLNFARGGDQDEQGFAGLVQQKLRGVRLHFDIAQVLVRFGVDNPDFAVVLTDILTAVSYIQKLAVRIVRDTAVRMSVRTTAKSGLSTPK